MKRHPGIYKRGNIYWITYTWHGRQYFESSHSTDCRDAEALHRKRRTEFELGRLAVRSSETLTVDELIDSYIAQIENPATQKRYRLSQSVLSPICGNSRITDIDAFTFDRFKELRIKAGVSSAGVNRDIALYRAAFNFAVERRLLVHSPLDGVRLFDEEKQRKAPRVLSFADEQRVLICCDLRLRTIVMTLLDTGMRVGIEALRLKWADIDFDDEIIAITQSKTSAGLRALPMTPIVKSALLEWRVATKGISEYVFFNPQHQRMHIRSVKTAWHNALKMARLPRFPIYQCRHTFATRLVASGVSDTIVDQLLGHSRRDVLRYYTARVLEYHRDAMSRLHQLRIAKSQLIGASGTDAIDELSRKGTTVVN